MRSIDRHTVLNPSQHKNYLAPQKYRMVSPDLERSLNIDGMAMENPVGYAGRSVGNLFLGHSVG
jgi:hypothetical protein